MKIVRFTVAVFFVLVSVSSSNAAIAPPSGGGSGGGDARALPCIQKLKSCQPYLHSVIPPLPASCCLSMKEMVANDAPCLCSVFNNVDMLKSLNLTKDNALDIPKACYADPDISLCKASPADAFKFCVDQGPTTNSTSSTPTSSAPAINFAGLSFASTIVALATTFF
ncbi:hypothetical protein BRARA_I04794 [Brassica rapa]|uniref:Bifunctional inhibitor/plant lipid transfer protein/seed storage helical domain-containing protein n=1 Tax=Brassica campestris TaxID=3711 RepID=A0A397Y3U2_BRACM|nr:hypothetical protein BRARA_I04794 [Brassica rapa]